MSFDDGSGALVPAAVVHRAHSQRTISEVLIRQDSVRSRSRLARFFGVSPLSVHSAPWFWSAIGMLRVGSALDGLSPEFRVFHDIPGPIRAEEAPSGIAHLVIGPPGVFTVSAHNHTRENVWAVRRDFVVDGHRLPYIRWAEMDVGFAERALSVAADCRITASAVIAVIDPVALTVQNLPRDVAVIRASSLSSWFSTRSPVLDANQVERLSAAAEHPATWGSDGDGGAEALDQRGRFDKLRREVDSARMVRALWVIGVAAVVSAATITVGILQLTATSP